MIKVCGRRLAVWGWFAGVALLAHMTQAPRAAADQPAPPPGIQQSLRFVPGRMVHYHVPGLSLALIHDGNLDWAQTFGVASPGGAPVTSETLFQASSIGMPLTAVAVLRLVEQRKLDLDMDVNQYLKSRKIPGNRFTEQKKVTLRELLSHTAGTTVHGFGGYAAGEKIPSLLHVRNGETPANSAPVTIDFVPGTKFRYAGGNYVIIQQILVDMTGKPFPELMQELVLQPLHMEHSSFQQSLPAELAWWAAMPYDKDGNAIGGGPRNYPEMAVAGLWTTPSDLALFVLAIQNALSGKPGLGFYGLGFFMAGNGASRYFSHPGANPGYLSFFFAYEKGDGLVLMSNSQYSKSLCLEVIRALSKQYGWTDFPTESRFSNPWLLGLICTFIVLGAFLVVRSIAARKRTFVQKSP